jgi:hypothetical protein
MIASVALIAAHAEGSQPPPAGIFVLTAESPSTVSIAAKDIDDYKSPALFIYPVDVVADGVTENLDVIPGLSIVFDALVVGSTSEIGVGCYWDASINEWQRICSLGLCLEGIEGADAYVTVTNNTGLDQSNCLVIVSNSARIVNGIGPSQPIFAFRQTGALNSVAHDDLLGKAITFDNLVEGTPNIVDILVDGEMLDVIDVATDDLIVEGIELDADGVTVYRFADTTDYQSCEFILSADLVETDTAQIYVSDGGDFVELYDEVNGGYVPGSTGVYLTAENCGLGVVPDGESVTFRMRLNPDTGGSVALNQRQFSIRIFSMGIFGTLPSL